MSHQTTELMLSLSYDMKEDSGDQLHLIVYLSKATVNYNCKLGSNQNQSKFLNFNQQPDKTHL
jgi:hypothetical protein